MKRYPTNSEVELLAQLRGTRPRDDEKILKLIEQERSPKPSSARPSTAFNHNKKERPTLWTEARAAFAGIRPFEWPLVGLMLLGVALTVAGGVFAAIRLARGAWAAFGL